MSCSRVKKPRRSEATLTCQAAFRYFSSYSWHFSGRTGPLQQTRWNTQLPHALCGKNQAATRAGAKLYGPEWGQDCAMSIALTDGTCVESPQSSKIRGGVLVFQRWAWRRVRKVPVSLDSLLTCVCLCFGIGLTKSNRQLWFAHIWFLCDPVLFANSPLLVKWSWLC